MKNKAKKTKIVCTIGPASQSEEMLTKMARAGMNVARLNFSHNEHAYHANTIEMVRHVSQKIGTPIAILQDLQGPKIRIGTFKNPQGIELKRGQEFIITTEDIEGDEKSVSTSFRQLPRDARVGNSLLLDDGNLRLIVTKVDSTKVYTKVEIGGHLSNRKGINLPGVLVSAPALTRKDQVDLQFGIEHQVDYVAISFVQRASDILQVRDEIMRFDASRVNTPVIAKLEKPMALENLESIVDAAQGVMVARGDLGVELGPHKVPAAQKRIISQANRHGKIVITATQMLESMVHNPVPTRAEASDVANAVYDGSDAIMLSAESAVGKYPVEAVKMMSTIARESEGNTKRWGRYKIPESAGFAKSIALASAARSLTKDEGLSAIVVFSQTGNNARVVSKQRPNVPILAFTPDAETYQKTALMWGVESFLMPRASSLEDMLRQVDHILRQETPLEDGQRVAIMAGVPVHMMVPANMIMVHEIGEYELR